MNLGNYRKRVWYEALDAAGLKRRPLCQTMHTCATLALAADARIEWVSQLMEHRDIRTTLRFTRGSCPRSTRATWRLSDRLFSAGSRAAQQPS